MHFEIKRLLPALFPPLLREIPDAPERLFIRGTMPFAEQVFLCVVGSRAATPYGLRSCMSLIAGLAGRPVAIVSGLALGMDAQAHKAALAAGLPTIAVLPSGLDDTHIYPALNRPLALKILEAGGALISEYEEGAPAGQWTFPARNRIMAGLSRAVLLVEANEKSGTLITARLALDYNRDVLAVPHPIGSDRGAGGNRLIREGATLVRDAHDIEEALGFKREEESVRELPADLDEKERPVLAVLTEALTREEIIQRCGLHAQSVNIALSSLSLRGLLAERMGKIERL